MTIKAITICHSGSTTVQITLQGTEDINCKAWKITDHVEDVQHLLSNSHLQFLTSMEADACLNNLFDALAINGQIEIIVPDANFHARHWLNAEWNELTLRDCDSEARNSFAGLFGWQQGGNPQMNDYQSDYVDCYKSGYNSKRLEFLLQRVGFVDTVVTHHDDQTLKATARKTMRKGERQISPDIHNIRADHLNRYKFSVSQLTDMKPVKVLDLACGIGYGANMLAYELGCAVVAVDVDQGAISYAEKHYSHPAVNFICADARTLELPENSFDAIISFETIEHIDFDSWLLKHFNHLLRQGGRLVVSTPNQAVMPHDPIKHPFHIRHYNVEDISSLLTEAGFLIKGMFTQHDPISGEVLPGDDGAFTVIVAEKP